MIMGETRGLIGGYCENEFPVYYANEEMARMLGYDAVEEMVEAIDGKVINTIHPDDREQVIKDIGGGKYYEGLTYETTYRMPRKDGSWFWTVDKGKVIRTEEGKLAIISACQDMTSFVERHKKLEEQNILSQATIDNIPGGYHRCSLEEGIHSYISVTGSLRFLGGPEKRSKQNSIISLTICFIRMTGIFLQNIPPVFLIHADMDLQDQIYRLLGKDGYHWVTDATTLVKSGNQIFFQGDITDITDFVKGKEKTRKNWKTATRF